MNLVAQTMVSVTVIKKCVIKKRLKRRCLKSEMIPDVKPIQNMWVVTKKYFENNDR